MNQINSIHSISTCTLWTALITPFDHRGDIDFTSLTHLANAQNDAGNGILLLGSTGEGLALSTAEQKSVVDHVCQLSLSVPIMVAVGGYQLTQQLDWVNYCNQLPIDAYLLGAPLYAKPGVKGQQRWFEKLLDEATFPCMLYNVPSRSGVSLSEVALSNLQHHKNFWALKEASGDIQTFQRYQKACPELAMFSGEDSLLPALVSAGAKGLVSVAANVWPQATMRYVDCSLSGQSENLLKVWLPAIESLFSQSNPIPAKVLLAHKQQITTPELRAPLTHDEVDDLSILIKSDEQISAWLDNQHCAFVTEIESQQAGQPAPAITL